MNLLALALAFIIFVVVLILLVFIWVGGKRFFNTVVGMKDELHQINNNLAFFVSENRKEHEEMSKKLELQGNILAKHDVIISRHEEILKKKEV